MAKGPVLKTGETARCLGSNPSSSAIYAQIAQSVEQGTENPCVRGSIPRLGTTENREKVLRAYFIGLVEICKMGFFLLIRKVNS